MFLRFSFIFNDSLYFLAQKNCTLYFSVPVELYTVFLVKTLAKNLVKNLVKNLAKNLPKFVSVCTFRVYCTGVRIIRLLRQASEATTRQVPHKKRA